MSSYTQQEWEQESEANIFACCVLMPEEMFLKEYSEERRRIYFPEVRPGKPKKRKVDPEDMLIYNLAATFQVPMFAVVWRIQMLTDKIRKLPINAEDT